MSNKESRKQRTIRKAKERRQVEDAVKDIQFYSQFVPNEALNISEEISDWLNNDNNWWFAKNEIKLLINTNTLNQASIVYLVSFHL